MKTWKPAVAGILCVVAGAPAIVIAIIASLLGRAGILAGMPLVSAIIGIVVLPVIILGIVAIIGGIYALRRERWGLALAGAICALVPPAGILGIPAIIFIILGKDEFKEYQSPSSSPPLPAPPLSSPPPPPPPPAAG